jgi:tetratricopeptide (TPR) repeat protein
MLTAGDTAAAEDALNRAIASDSTYGRAWSNLGNLLQSRRMMAEARMAHESALSIDRNDPDFHWNYAITLLLDGDLKEGFAEYEWRRKIPGFGKKQITGPTWDGSKPRGRTILLYAEQGLGDTLMFSRYAPMLARTGAAVVLACPEKLAPLLATLEGPVKIVSNLDDVEYYDWQAPLMSLPHLMGTTMKTVPGAVPYLSTPPGTESPVPASQAGCRIGLVWAGNPENPDARNRSIPLEKLKPLFEVAGVEWISLQIGAARRQILETGVEIHDLAPELAETAAAIADLDLVITIDSAIAHLAGALGRPFWLLLSYAPDWRWLLDRDDTPWYPTARLFRQPVPGDWASVVHEVRDELHAFTTR